MKKIIVLAAAMALGTMAVTASIITETVTVAPTGLNNNLTFTFAQFDPALGTLNNVSLTLTPVLGNFGASAFNFNGSSSTASGFSVSRPTGTLTSIAFPSLQGIWTSSATLTSPDFSAAPSGLTYGPALSGFNFITSAASVSTGPAGFVGLGNYSLSAAGIGTATVTGSGPLFSGWYGNVGGILQVDYDYTPVPEPSTYIAGALLLLPFGAHVIRRLRTRS